jgi:FkbM family methyltransferase
MTWLATVAVVAAAVFGLPLSAAQAPQLKPDDCQCPPSPFEKGQGYYGQFYEDYVLAYVLADVPKGFYVDVGANDPNRSNVTKLFYDKGWTGINIEPNVAEYEKIVKFRPRDRNYNCGIGDKAGVMTFYQGEGRNDQISTFDAKLAESLRRDKGFRLKEVQVPVITLTTLLSKEPTSEITFMSIDVEGFEAQVLRGLDLTRFKPVVFCVEATQPGTEIPAYAAWEGRLLKAGYVFALFDGLNRYYVRNDTVSLLPRFIFIDMCVKRSKYLRQIKLDGFTRWE